MRMNYWLDKYILLFMVLFPLINIVLFWGNGTELDGSMVFWAKQFAICVVVAVAEELFFRGLVLREIVFSYHWQQLRASLIVSFAFGVLHLLNVNSYATWNYAIVQSVCAFAVSFALCAIFLKTKCLFWCVAIHALINATSIGWGEAGRQLVLSNVNSVVFLLVSLIYFISGIKILNNKMVEGK